MSTKLASHWVIVNQSLVHSKTFKDDLVYSRPRYLNRVHLRTIAKSKNIVDARAFKTEEEARKVLDELAPFYGGRWSLQEVTRDLDVLNENGLPYLRRFKVLKEVE
jgi:hypothetical protein